MNRRGTFGVGVSGDSDAVEEGFVEDAARVRVRAQVVQGHEAGWPPADSFPRYLDMRRLGHSAPCHKLRRGDVDSGSNGPGTFGFVHWPEPPRFGLYLPSFAS